MGVVASIFIERDYNSRFLSKFESAGMAGGVGYSFFGTVFQGNDPTGVNSVTYGPNDRRRNSRLQYFYDVRTT